MSGPSIYTASKTVHAPKWREFRDRGNRVISTWIDEAGVGETKSFEDLWRRCVSEAASADVLLVYREPGEVLKGAFVEVGAALAAGKPVVAIGCDDFSFVSHRLVRRVGSLGVALASLIGPGWEATLYGVEHPTIHAAPLDFVANDQGELVRRPALARGRAEAAAQIASRQDRSA